MYKSVWEFVRPTKEIAFPPGSDSLNQLRESAVGFVNKEISFSNGGLTKTVKTVWNSEEDAMNFMVSHNELISEANALLIDYCETHNIKATRSIE